MQIRESATALRAYANGQGVELDALDARGALVLMTNWYSDERVTNALPLEESGDGLLVQWGTYSFGAPETFQYDITRQFIAPGRGRDSQGTYWQLNLTVHYPPDPSTAELQDTTWIFDPAQVPAVREELAANPVLAVLDGRKVEMVDVYLGQV